MASPRFELGGIRELGVDGLQLARAQLEELDQAAQRSVAAEVESAVEGGG